jgi:putative hemolysin
VETGLIVDIVIAVLALILYACAGVAELGGSAITRRRVHALQEDIRSGKRTTHSLVESARKHAASIEVVRLITLVITVVAITDAVERTASELHWFFNLIILIGVLLVAGIGLPRAFLAAAPEEWIEKSAHFSNGIAEHLNPILRLADLLATPIRLLLPGREGGVIASEDEVRAATRRNSEDEELQEAEQEMIDGVLRLEDMVASEIMVPRVDMIAASVTMPVRQILQKITTTGHSRIPIYEQSIDEILGVLHAKDLLPFLNRDGRTFEIRRLLRPVYIVPESKRVDELLRDMRSNNDQVAIIADEYGGIAGLVTIEDIMEVIVGEIRDEYDIEEEELVTVSDDELLAEGSVSMEEIQYELDLEPEDDDEEDYDTVGGFVLKYLERLPMEGDVVEAQGIRVEVLSVDRHRVKRVRITRLHPTDDDLASQSDDGE